MTQAILTAHSYSTRALELVIEALRTLYSAQRRHSEIRQTIKELNQLNDKELNDIGLCRGDIRNIARGDSTLIKSESNVNLKGWV
jgi:uncharacterized protein YjiS (DUF1127 family)